MFAEATLRRPPSLLHRSAALRAEPRPADRSPTAAPRVERGAPAAPRSEPRLGPAWEVSALRGLYGA